MELEPGYFYAHMELGWAYLQKGMQQAAVTHCDSAIARAPGIDQVVLGTCGWVYGRAEHRPQAGAIVRRLTALSARRWVDPYNLSLVYVGLGDTDRALASLREAARQGSPSLVFLKVEPFLDPLRSDPRFKALLRELGIGS